jgi:hypothetical protein
MATAVLPGGLCLERTQSRFPNALRDCRKSNRSPPRSPCAEGLLPWMRCPTVCKVPQSVTDRGATNPPLPDLEKIYMHIYNFVYGYIICNHKVTHTHTYTFFHHPELRTKSLRHCPLPPKPSKSLAGILGSRSSVCCSEQHLPSSFIIHSLGSLVALRGTL